MTEISETINSSMTARPTSGTGNYSVSLAERLITKHGYNIYFYDGKAWALPEGMSGTLMELLEWEERIVFKDQKGKSNA